MPRNQPYINHGNPKGITYAIHQPQWDRLLTPQISAPHALRGDLAGLVSRLGHQLTNHNSHHASGVAEYMTLSKDPFDIDVSKAVPNLG